MCTKATMCEGDASSVTVKELFLFHWGRQIMYFTSFLHIGFFFLPSPWVLPSPLKVSGKIAFSPLCPPELTTFYFASGRSWPSGRLQRAICLCMFESRGSRRCGLCFEEFNLSRFSSGKHLRVCACDLLMEKQSGGSILDCKS